MKICAAQTRPITGDIQANIAHYRNFIERAAANEVELIIFPELSLTGYEPTLARELATDPADTRFDEFQDLSDTHGMTVGVGAPAKTDYGICIGMLLFQPFQERHCYAKGFLHSDEEPFFVRGRSTPHLQVKDEKIALAICYEISVPEHLESALNLAPTVYCASVAKFVKGFDKATERLSTIAKECSLPVLMSNCVGFADGQQCAGKTSVWNRKGLLLGQLSDTDEGMLIFDTATHALVP